MRFDAGYWMLDTGYWIFEVWSYEFRVPKVYKGRIAISIFNSALDTSWLDAFSFQH
jgi:hypothetical protein